MIARPDPINRSTLKNALADDLTKEEIKIVEEIRQKFNLIRRTVQRDLLKLADLGLIRVVSKSKTDPTKYYELL